MGIAHGTGIGIGLFLLLIAANGVGMVIKNPIEGLPVALGAFTSFPVMMSLLGLAVIFGLEKCRVPGGILLVIIAISIIGLIFDPAVKYHGLVAMPSLTGEDGKSDFQPRYYGRTPANRTSECTGIGDDRSVRRHWHHPCRRRSGEFVG